jgi:ribosomal protein L12E/L44/L45/RPP1/RPP2
MSKHAMENVSYIRAMLLLTQAKEVHTEQTFNELLEFVGILYKVESETMIQDMKDFAKLFV